GRREYVMRYHLEWGGYRTVEANLRPVGQDGIGTHNQTIFVCLFPVEGLIAQLHTLRRLWRRNLCRGGFLCRALLPTPQFERLLHYRVLRRDFTGHDDRIGSEIGMDVCDLRHRHP